MENNVLKRSISILLLLIILFSSMPLQVLAVDNTTHDYSELKTMYPEGLHNKYSYGTVFWSDSSEVKLTSNNTASSYWKGENENLLTYGDNIEAKKGEIIEARLTNSAVDEDGDVCDVILRVDNISEFDEKNKNPVFTSDIIVSITISRYPNSNLMKVWFGTRSASSHFTMKYVKAGTNNIANIKGNIATIYDLDAYANKEGEIWNGAEGFTIDGTEGEVYYKKIYDNGKSWIIDTENDKGTRVPNSNEGCPFEQTNDLIEENSAVVMEKFKNDATFKLFYSGYGCGIGFTFASPYPFKIESPTLEVDKTRVYENERFNYKIHQYIPNNYYATQLNFIEGISSWNEIKIVDEINSNLNIYNDISIVNENGENVSKYFEDVIIENNIITAKVKTEALNDVNFYSHKYTINVPVSFKSGSGKKLGEVKNTAYTIVDEQKLDTNEVTTALKYDYVVNAVIDNGNISVNSKNQGKTSTDSDVINHNNSKSSVVEFTLDEKYELSKVIVDGKEVEVINQDGKYSYIIQDQNITNNIEHNVVVISVKKDASVLVHHYIEGTTRSISEDKTITAKIGDEYTTEVATDIPSKYELVAIPENANGKMTEDQIVVTYYYRLKDTSVLVHQYIEGTETSLSDDVTIDGKVDDKYKTEVATDIPSKYELVAIPENANGIMTEDQIVVTYYYRLKDTSVLVHHYIEGTTTSISEDKTITAKIGDKYITTVATDIPSKYELVAIPENASGIMTEDQIVVTWYYRLKEAKVNVKYIDEKTGEEIEEQETIEGYQNDPYSTKEKDIKYYKIVKEKYPKNAKGTMIDKETEVKYYYRKLTFNMKADKWIEKLIVNGNEEKGNSPEKNNIIKLEIHRKKLKETDVKIVYKIRITNTEELDGYVGKVEDILPKGLIFDEKDNEKYWKRDGNKIVADLSKELIKAGETKELEVVLGWNKKSEDLGIKTNRITINNITNEAGYEETTKDDNEAETKMIITISTGEDSEKIIITIQAITTMLMLIGASIAILRKNK